MKNITPDNIEFKIEGIELLEYSINSPNTKLPENTPYRFDLNIEHKISIEFKKVFVIISLNILYDELKLNLGHAKISCIYAFPNVDYFQSKENSMVEMPEALIITLNSISLSTSRGVMFALFRGTFLHNIILPIVDPKSFTKNGR